MITDEERREVAAKLREIREDEHGEVYMYDVMLALGIESGKAAYWADKEFIYHLADLIDRPTCENGERLNERTFLCSACGYEAYAYSDSDCNPNDFSYCPDCGAEVIE